MHRACEILEALFPRTHLLSAYTVEPQRKGGIHNKESNPTKLINSFWKKPKSLIVQDAHVTFLGPDYSAEFIALASYLEAKHIPNLAEDTPHVTVNASQFGAKQARVDLMFVDAFMGFHVSAAFGTAVKYLLPSSTASVTFVGYFWDEARTKLGPERAAAMKHSDVAALTSAGVDMFTFTQKPGDLVVLHPLCAHMVCFHGEAAAHLSWLLPRITADMLALYVSAFGHEKSHLPLLQYDMELHGLLGLEKHILAHTQPPTHTPKSQFCAEPRDDTTCPPL
jgi:hypothetical protein